jgi:hypothetical protein
MLGIGQFIAPPFGSQMSAAYGFRLTMDVVALIFLIFAMLYFVLAGGVDAARLTAKNYS